MRTIVMIILSLGYVGAAIANTMECYNGILDTAEPEPPTKKVVRQRCGEPDEERNQGYEWFYQHSEFSYLLRFKQNGELLDIQRNHRRD